MSACLISTKFRATLQWFDRSIAAAFISVPLAAAGLVCFFAGPVADKIGRKKFLLLSCIIHIIGVIIQLAIHTVPSFLIGKIIAGVSTGMYSVMCPLYQSEISLPNHRGRLITMHQFGVTLGFCTAFWSAYGAYYTDAADGWTIPVGLQIVPPVIMLVGLFMFIPESPRWLIYQNRHAEAKSILQKLRAKEDANDLDLSMEYIGIIQERNYDQNYTSKSYANLLSRGIDNNRGRTILGVGLHVMTQLTGINAILFYLPYILESTGLAKIESAMLGNGVSSMVNMLATLPTFLYVDRWGRRRILMVGSLAMAICMIIIAAVQGSFSTKAPDYKPHVFPGSLFPIATSMTNDTAVYVVLIFLCLFLGCFALSWGSMGWIYPAEIYPQSIRAKGLGVTTGASYAMSICVSQVAPILFKELSWGTYLFFGAVCLIQVYIVHRYYPETKGRSLEEIQLIFSGALIDQSPGAHHPQTAFEALSHLNHSHVQTRIDLSRSVSTSLPLLRHFSQQHQEYVSAHQPEHLQQHLPTNNQEYRSSLDEQKEQPYQHPQNRPLPPIPITGDRQQQQQLQDIDDYFLVDDSTVTNRPVVVSNHIIPPLLFDRSNPSTSSSTTVSQPSPLSNATTIVENTKNNALDKSLDYNPYYSHNYSTTNTLINTTISTPNTTSTTLNTFANATHVPLTSFHPTKTEPAAADCTLDVYSDMPPPNPVHPTQLVSTQYLNNNHIIREDISTKTSSIKEKS